MTVNKEDIQAKLNTKLGDLFDFEATPALSEHGAFLHTMTDADRQVVKDLTSAINRLAAAQEETNKQNSWAGERIPRKG